MIGFMYNPTVVTKRYREFFDTWVDECDTRLQDNHDCMVIIKKQCEESSTTLKDIKHQLIPFKDAQAFDQINLKIIKSDYKIMKEHSTAALENTRRIRNKGGDVQERIPTHKKQFETSMKIYHRKYAAVALVLGVLFGFMAETRFSTGLCSVYGTLAGLGVAQTSIYCNSYDEKAISNFEESNK